MINAAESDDLAQIRKVAHEVYAAYVPRFSHTPPGPVIADYAVPVAAHRLYVFRQPDIRGFIVCYPHGDDYRIDNLVVLPRYRRLGIGRQLLTFAEAHAHGEGCHRLAVEVHIMAEDSIAFYRQHGFSKTGQETGEDGIERAMFEMRLKKSPQGC